MIAANDPLTVLRAHDIAQLTAPNPGPYTLRGTNSWIVGRDPAYVIDPGPSSGPHLDALLAELAPRGELAAILLTHDHSDHAGGAEELSARTGAPLAAMRADAQIPLADGAEIGPFTVVATPGHAPDHAALVAGRVCFTGDAVLGHGYVFIAAAPGAMAGYLEGLRRLRALDLELLAPGHGPLVADAAGKLDDYIGHRMERERMLLEALADGVREREDLLDRVWPAVSPALRTAAGSTLDAHLAKLAEEGRLPAD